MAGPHRLESDLGQPRQRRAPALVTHGRFDHAAPFEQGRLIAASIPNARLVALESDNHPVLPDEPAWATWLHEMETFLAG